MENKEQVTKTATELRQGIKNRAELQRFVELFKDTVKELAKDAEWYEACNASVLAEQCLYCERGVHDIIDLVRNECDTPDDVDELLDSFKTDAWNTFKFMRAERLEHLAELAMLQYTICCDLIVAVDQNKLGDGKENKEQVQVKRNGETVLDILYENERLRQRITKLEASNTRQGKLLSKLETIGRITTDIVAHDFLTSASLAVNGVTYQMDLCLSDEGRKPMVVLNDRAYILSWDDMVKLAEHAGLFHEVTE